MKIFALGFVLGAWWLQQQAYLPSPYSVFWLIPSYALIGYFRQSESPLLARKMSYFVFATLAGFLYAAMFASLRLSDELPKAWEQKSVNIVGVVASLPELTERGERFKFDVEKVLTTGAQVPSHISLNYYHQAPSNVDVTAASPRLAPNSQFHAGERYQLTVRLKRPHSTYNPHGFDFEAWALAENIRATGTINSKSGFEKLSQFVWRPSYIVEYLREKIGNRISNTLANKPYAGVIRALVVGDDSQISAPQWNVFLRTGVNHLMSISGLHITMLAGLAFGCVAFVWRRVPSMVLRMPTQRAATIAGMLVAIVYACLAGLSVPTQRTLMMLVVFAFALLQAKKLAISQVLAIALVLVTVFDPWAVIAPGFWLSFLAVALIAYVSVGRLQKVHWVKEAVHVQWAVTLGLLPLLIVMFGQTSLVSPLANAFAIPLVSLIVVPLAIFGAIFPFDVVLHVSHWVMDVCMRGLVWLAATPMATWSQAAPPMWSIALASLGVFWLLLPRGFPQRWLGLILLLPMLTAPVKRPANGEMRLVVVDVGQGLSVLFQTAQHQLLFDAGPSYNSQSDAGSKIIVPFLRGEGIQQLNGLIVSHNDTDHSGGAASVLAQVPVTWLASSYDLPQTKQSMPKQLHCYAGQSWEWDGVRFEMLHPSLESYQNPSIKDNNRGCVMKVTSQFGSALLSADIEKEAEAELLQTNSAKLASNLLIAPHHGSASSSTPAFIQAVGAKQVIFTSGYLNRFKHPKPLVVARYQATSALLYRSDYHGALIVNFTRNQAPQTRAWREVERRYWQDSYK